MMEPPIEATVVIRGGTIVDGTRAPAFVGDVAINGETICAIGENLKVTGVTREIDARGLLVTPGWIDPHTHYDGQVTWDPLLSPSTQNGVTTCIMGNCGVGFAPVQKELRGFLLDLMEAVEDIPGSALNEGIKWEWESFPEYMDALEKNNYACDVATMIGHSGVRTWVLGKRASMSDRPGGPENDPITPEEINAMAAVAKEAVAAGALGFSTSRLLLHRDKHGILTPGCLATTNELTAIARGVAEGGGGIVELSSDFTTYDDVPYNLMEKEKQKLHYKNELGWMRQASEENGDKIAVSFSTGPDQIRAFKTFADKFQATGAIFNCQIQTRPQSMHMSFASPSHLFLWSRTFRKLKKQMKGDLSALMAELSQETTRAAILHDISQYKPTDSTAKLDTDRSTIIYKNEQGTQCPSWMLEGKDTYPWTETYEPPGESMVLEMAKRAGKPPPELIYDLLMDTQGAHKGVLWRVMFGYPGDCEGIRKVLMEHEHAMPGFDDAGAHNTILTDATAPTHMICYWSRDRQRGPLMPLEHAVHLQTERPAKVFGLPDRGVLQPGKRADINVIDFENVKLGAPQYVYDLPTAAGRWVQWVEGYKWTLCRGVVTFENDQHTGAFPGRLVRNPRSIGWTDEMAVPPVRDIEEVRELDLTKHAVEISQSERAGLSAIARSFRNTENEIKKVETHSRL